MGQVTLVIGRIRTLKVGRLTERIDGLKVQREEFHPEPFAALIVFDTEHVEVEVLGRGWSMLMERSKDGPKSLGAGPELAVDHFVDLIVVGGYKVVHPGRIPECNGSGFGSRPHPGRIDSARDEQRP